MKLSARKLWAIRLTLSTVFGIAVASVPLYLILGSAQSNSTISYRHRTTMASLKKIDRMLRYYHEDKGFYPAKLEEINASGRDGWGHSWLYSLPDGQPLLESLGGDSKRGGVGLNADLSNRNLSPEAAHIPFWARLFEREVRGVTLASLACGAIAGLLFFVGMRRQTFEPKTLPILGISLLLSLALAAFGALVIATFHVPSGH